MVADNVFAHKSDYISPAKVCVIFFVYILFKVTEYICKYLKEDPERLQL